MSSVLAPCCADICGPTSKVQKRRDEKAGSPHVKIGCIENTDPRCGFTVRLVHVRAAVRRSTVTQQFVTVPCGILHANVTAKRQNSGIPQDMGGWTFLLFFNKGNGAFSWALHFQQRQADAIHAGGRRQCLEVATDLDQTKPDHLFTTA